MARSIRSLTLLLALLMGTTGVVSMPEGVSATETDEPPPYNVRHFDLVDLLATELPWWNEEVPRLPALRPRDENGVRFFRWVDGKLYYRPGGIAINGMMRLDAYRDTGDPAQLEQALVQAWHLRNMKLVRDDAWWLPFWFDYHPEGLKAPWFNAMSQGLALSFFVRLHRMTGDEVHLRAAEKIFDSFLRLGRTDAPNKRSWVAYVDQDGYLWLEHYPNAKPDHVLNAHLHAVIGLYEYWQYTRSPQARQVLEGSLTTMLDRAGQYRREGRVSIYGMRSRTNHYKYHQVHTWQLRLLGRMTGHSFFTELGDAMAEDRRSRSRVPGRPATRRMGVGTVDAPVTRRLAPYPPVTPALQRAA